MASGYESVAYDLGREMFLPCRSLVRIDKMTSDLVENEILVMEDGRGNGWILVNDLGFRVMPVEKGMVFADKGHAFLFWWGMGQPEGYRLILECDPLVEADIVFGEGVIDVDDVTVEREVHKLHIVR